MKPEDCTFPEVAFNIVYPAQTNYEMFYPPFPLPQTPYGVFYNHQMRPYDYSYGAAVGLSPYSGGALRSYSDIGHGYNSYSLPVTGFHSSGEPYRTFARSPNSMNAAAAYDGEQF